MPLLPNRDRKTDSGDALRPLLPLTKAQSLIQKDLASLKSCTKRRLPALLLRNESRSLNTDSPLLYRDPRHFCRFSTI